jgi:uncharacterized membrane protein
VLLSASQGSAGIVAGALVLLACLCWGMDNHLTTLIDGITPSQTTFWKSAVAGPFNLMVGLLSSPLVAEPQTVGTALVVGAVSYGLSIVLYIVSAQNMGATRSQIIFSSSPFFGVLLSAVFLGDTISLVHAAAMVLIAASCVLLVVERHAHLHRHPATSHEHWHRHDDGHHDHEHDEHPSGRWHSHWHAHRPVEHTHAHWPDLHHRHAHGVGPEGGQGERGGPEGA